MKSYLSESINVILKKVVKENGESLMFIFLLLITYESFTWLEVLNGKTMQNGYFLLSQITHRQLQPENP